LRSVAAFGQHQSRAAEDDLATMVHVLTAQLLTEELLDLLDLAKIFHLPRSFIRRIHHFLFIPNIQIDIDWR